MSQASHVQCRPEGTRSQALVNSGVLGVGGAAICLLIFDGWWQWVAVAGVLIATSVWAMTQPIPILTLTDDSLVLEQRGGQTRLPLDAIGRVEVHPIPYRDSIVEFTASDQRSITCRYSAESRDFLLAVGHALEPRRRQLHTTPSADKRLGWP